MTNDVNNDNLISFLILYHHSDFADNMKNICEKIKHNFSDINYEILLVKNKEYRFPYELLNNPRIRHIEVMNDHLYKIRILSFQAANGKYVHSIDVDNDYCFESLVNNMAIIKAAKYDILSFCSSKFKDNHKNLLSTDLWDVKAPISEITFDTVLKNTLCWSNKLVKKSLKKQMSSEFEITYDEDVLAFMQMNKTNLKILHINEPLTIILYWKNSISRTFNGLQMEVIIVNKFLKTITTAKEFQILLFKYVCSNLVDIKLINNKKQRKEYYGTLKKYINDNYDHEIMKILYPSKIMRIANRPWFISIVAFIMPRWLLKQILLKKIHT